MTRDNDDEVHETGFNSSLHNDNSFVTRPGANPRGLAMLVAQIRAAIAAE